MSNNVTKRVRLRKGTEQEHVNFAGVLAEVTIDTTKKTLRVHDGVTLGGFEVRKSRYEIISSSTSLAVNVKYFADTSLSPFEVTLPQIKSVGDCVVIVDAESYWDINNLTVLTQNNEQFKDYTGLVESPLVCDVPGASVELIWEGNYWRVIA